MPKKRTKKRMIKPILKKTPKRRTKAKKATVKIRPRGSSVTVKKLSPAQMAKKPKLSRTKKLAKSLQNAFDRINKKSTGATRADKNTKLGSYGSKKDAERRTRDAAYGHLKKKKKK